MTTFSALKAKVSKRLLDESNQAVGADDVGDAINASIKYWKQKHFWFNEFTEEITLDAGNPVIPLPSTVTMFRPFRKGGLIIRYQGQPYEVCPVRPQQYDNNNDEIEDRPCVRTYRGGQYLAYPYPDQGYTATWYGLKDYAALSADAAENDFTTYGERLVMYDALARLLVEFRRDFEAASVFETAAEGEYQNLKSTTEEFTGTGVLEIETILN